MLLNKTNTFQLANPDIVFEEFDGEYVILDLSSGSYHAVDGSAALIWNLLMSGASPAHIAKGLQDNQSISDDAAADFIGKLVTQGLIKDSGTGAIKELSQSEMDALNELDVAPATDVFDDLADLILSDPIHDVDESAGWPVRPADR